METAMLMNALLFQVKALRHRRRRDGGTLIAAFVAFLWSRYGHRVNLSRFFQVTAIFLLVFVVQLLIYGFHELAKRTCCPTARRSTGRRALRSRRRLRAVAHLLARAPPARLAGVLEPLRQEPAFDVSLDRFPSGRSAAP
jgi:hypothetical protein